MSLEKVRNSGRGVAFIYKDLILPHLITAVTVSYNKNSTFLDLDMVPSNDRISSVFNPAIFVKSYYSVQDPNTGRVILLNGTGSRKIKLNIVYTKH